MCKTVFPYSNWKILQMAKFFTQPAVVIMMKTMSRKSRMRKMIIDHRRSFSKKRSSMYPVSDVTETYRLSSMRAHGENPCKSSFLPLTSVFVEIMAFSSKMMI